MTISAAHVMSTRGVEDGQAALEDQVHRGGACEHAPDVAATRPNRGRGAVGAGQDCRVRGGHDAIPFVAAAFSVAGRRRPPRRTTAIAMAAKTSGRSTHAVSGSSPHVIGVVAL